MAFEEKRGTIAVVMCTYFGETYISAQLDSIFAQTLLPDAVYVYDDGSADNTREIIGAYRKRYPDIIRCVWDGQHRGINGAVGYVLARTGEDLVFLSDQDDIWHPDKIRKMAEYAWSRECWKRVPCIVHSESSLFTDRGETGKVLSDLIGRRTVSPATEDLFAHNLVQGCTMLVNQPLIRLACRKRMDAYFPHCIYDQWLALIAAELGHIWFLEEPLVYYRIHGKNVVGSLQVNIHEKYGLSRNRKIACDFLWCFQDCLEPASADRLALWIRRGWRKITKENMGLLLKKGAMALCLGIKSV